MNIDFDHKKLTMADCWLLVPTPYTLWSLLQGMFTYISNLSLNTKLSDILKINLGVKTMLIGLPRLIEATTKKNVYTATTTF